MTTIFLSGSINPDSEALRNKETIDISISMVDVFAVGETESIQTNYSATTQTIIIDATTNNGSVYYTPLYTEKIDYEAWLRKIDRNFQELN